MHSFFYATPYTTGITGSKEMPQTQSYLARENEDGLKRANENRIRYAHAFQQNMTSCDEILFHIRPESYHSCLSEWKENFLFFHTGFFYSNMIIVTIEL